ncbi:hypothetical protein E4U43_000890 [Claviceps pusilla]|uniref:Uncharacterized protein n=1 Tax=Claviceps pusilla TaxID=123648 RepID=A0A9P7N8T1_9HYPO|nr:hypothetical protein E4U43_000890 [Claviceps pusilla]
MAPGHAIGSAIFQPLWIRIEGLSLIDRRDRPDGQTGGAGGAGGLEKPPRSAQGLRLANVPSPGEATGDWKLSLAAHYGLDSGGRCYCGGGFGSGSGGWVGLFYANTRAEIGLPTLSSYLPWKRSENPYGPPQPAPGGVVGWFNDQVRKVKNRNNRSAAGAYEQPLQGTDGAAARRGFGPLDPDEAWDARVGHEADGYGYLEEAELGRHGPTEYVGGGAGYSVNLAATPGGAIYDDDDDDLERGHHLGRGRNPNPNPNPFEDDAVSSLRGVSPRPMETTAAPRHESTADNPDGAAGSGPTIKRSGAPRENA